MRCGMTNTSEKATLSNSMSTMQNGIRYKGRIMLPLQNFRDKFN